MKKNLLPLLLLLAVTAKAQITITNSDMPSVSQWNVNDVDTYRLSVIDGPDTISLSNTGANSSWDFSFLQFQDQKVDTFVNTIKTDPQYYVNFNNPWDDTYYASYAQAVSPPPNFSSTFQLTDVYYYYKNTSSKFTMVGFGAKLNGVSISQKYDPVDVIYEFPLSFGNTSSSTSDFNFTLPGSSTYYGRNMVRNNTVDGWGNITTPFGTFPALRVRSEMKITDTLWIEDIQYGFLIPRPTQYEYKWLGDGQGLPLLQINTQETNNNEVISQIIYRDIVRIDIVGSDSPLQPSSDFTIFPNPGNGQFRLILNGNVEEMVVIRNILGEIVFSSYLTKQGNTSDFFFSFSDGLYFIQIGTCTKKLLINN